MKKRPRKSLPGIDRLEPRQLLSLAGTWQGQDGHDLAGRTPVPLPSGVQDVHLGITGLPTDRAVVSAEISGLGGGLWRYHGIGTWAAAFVRSGGTTGELFFEPYQQETGRLFDVVVRYDDGTSDLVHIAGGAADPGLRMPSDSLQVAWSGQDGHDAVGRGPAVGPDGIQDVHLRLSNLTASVPITAVRVEGPPGVAWASGTNPEGVWSAQLDRRADDPTQADLWLNPDRDMLGEELSVTVVYATGTTDMAVVTAGATDPARAVAAPAPPPPRIAGVTGAWLGQDGLAWAAPGDVHLAIEGLPAGRAIASAVLTDAAGLSWAYQAPGSPAPVADDFSAPLSLRAAGPTAELAFPPRRDETGSFLSLRLNLDDGSIAIVPITGSAVDLSLRAPLPDATAVTAHPGDDLNDLAARFGAIRLAAGTYPLDRPLVLPRAVTITADPGATLLFTQAGDADSWTAAIKVHAANTTLDGFAVRFAGPIRWDWDVPYGPAVIGTTDNRDQIANAIKTNLTFTHLDVQGPPVADGGELQASPGLFRLVTADSGRIADNTLRGGTIEVIGGPWSITDNSYNGAVDGTSAAAFIAGHDTHDLVVAGNHAEPLDGSGKAWRFLVLTRSGFQDRIEDNTVVGIGPRDDDGMADPNATEIVLTEAYRLKFEGRPLAVSPDGLIVQVPPPQGGPAEAGDVVAILDGPDAGQWRRVVQTIDERTYLLDGPLPTTTGAVSIGAGMVNETFQGNTIDSRGSSLAADMVLAGAHYGTQVIGNRLLGGRYALLARSGPSESPVAWGWSHTPQLGLSITGNTLVDAVEGSVLGVEHAPTIQSTKGRVYFAAAATDNTFGFSPAFVVAHPAPVALTVGALGALDPHELRLDLSGSESRGSASTIRVHTAEVNGQAAVDAAIALPLATPAPPEPPVLAFDTGMAGRDGVTHNNRVRFAPVPGAVSYEYRIGDTGTFHPLADAGVFRAWGLSQGVNTVWVRAVDSYGVRGPAAGLTFVYDTTPPPAVTGLSATGTTTPVVRFDATGPDDIYIYRANRGPNRVLRTPDAFPAPDLVPGVNTVTVRAMDRAGNIGPAAILVVVVTPPPPLVGEWVGQDGADRVGPSVLAAPDGIQDMHLRLTGLRTDRALASVVVTGLGGGIWNWNGPAGTWAAAVVRPPGAATADLYIQPYQVETGRAFRVDIRYDDGTTDGAWVTGGAASPTLRSAPEPTQPGQPVPAGTLKPLPGPQRRITTPRWRRAALLHRFWKRRGG